MYCMAEVVWLLIVNVPINMNSLTMVLWCQIRLILLLKIPLQQRALKRAYLSNTSVPYTLMYEGFMCMYASKSPLAIN